ncbi:TPA: RNA-directed DNA polymerase [Raoultella planticola]|uniref:reverse transcriptase domain-containing protein n=1 Tax=Citrobacter freundii TaxID=546 RepID=UPI001A254262|nr:reverse transcriptase domain-containing protein [Citrobacter freundii]MDV1152874.1 reverse transcriptase domain-containing protein [Citrobacter freundii]MEB0499274.1 reverse transcriptase domain-containing protein [Citrobacter freundii]HAT1633814.1 RNA-directed DNA polymerase [Raoultella planticola]
MTEIIKSSWDHLVGTKSPDGRQKEIFKKYIQDLEKNGLPVIFEFEHFAYLLGMTNSTLAQTIINPEKSYRSFHIKKKRGGSRLINAPYPLISYIQKWINTNILSKIKNHESSFAYKKNSNAYLHALQHIDTNETLKVDIVDFFGSIKKIDIVRLFRELGYADNVSLYLASACTYANSLPQGAVTSPNLSNIIFYSLDNRFYHLAIKLNLTYSRYADDLFFSGEKIPSNLYKSIKSILQSSGFSINKEKTRHITNGKQKIITGLAVKENSVRIPKSYRRKFCQEAYIFIKNEKSNSSMENINFDPILIDRLIGKANYILKVEKNNERIMKLLKQLNEIKLNTF